MSNQSESPYFDNLPTRINCGDRSAAIAFGKHIHWGYWENPQLADGTLEDFAKAAEQLSAKMVEIAQIRDNLTILDAGCGFGGTISYLNDHFRNLNLIGINIDADQINRARELVQPKGDNKISFIQANACAIPVDSLESDRLLAVECIFAFPSRKQFFQEAYRLLKPGGKLTICDFLPAAWFAGIWQYWENKINPNIAKTYGTAKTDKPVFSFISLAQYRELAQSTGFKLATVVDITKNTLPTYPVVNRIMTKANPQKTIFNTTQGLAMISRLGWMGYIILDFVKE